LQKAWWKEAVVYQIYPRSFMDSNGDGIGDLQGIRSRMGYLKDLGIDVIWLSPVYESPNDDNGYDISDYYGIMKEFGTMQDFDELLQTAHDHGIKIMMDLVVNHTSDEHRWFVESMSAKDHPKRDYYVWRQGQDRREPNNWVSCFSGPAWEYSKETDEYFLHLFSKKQPDLNWENEQMRRDIYAMMTWWLEKGVDGFRMDVINFISKHPELPSVEGAQPGELRWGGEFFMNGPRIHDYLAEMNREVLSKHDIITVGEMPGATPEEALLYTGDDRNELQMVFQFEHMDLDSGPNGKWDLKPWSLADLKTTINRWQTELDGRGWNSLYLNNHDQPRLVSRFGDDTVYRRESATMLATFLHMLQGTPYIYQGEEIGMTNVRFASIDDYQDIETLNMYREAVDQRREDKAKVMESIYVKGRDNARTPMQWDASAHGGFTTGSPWLALNPNYRQINAAQAVQDPESIYSYYQQLIRLRKEHGIIVYGSYRAILNEHGQLFAYIRELGSEKLLVVCNFFGEDAEFAYPELQLESAELLLSNYGSAMPENVCQFRLRPYEAAVFLLK
jgi:oligo-1,6-glucosidase